ncbi:MAG: glycoside hydrolase family 38 C-terminal domain-containing protein [Verrucomicrobiota bacterium]|nr:glycoside hydrolase family 38 C-terminal domain-containing protein [Verrucomicrobiota bacterium]
MCHPHSITDVYRDSDRDYALVAQLAQKEIQKYEGANASGERYRVTNILGHLRREVVEFETGKPGIVTAPSCGVAVQEPVTEVEHPVSLTEENGRFIIENEFIRAKIGRCGKVASLIHKATSRDTIASSTAGQLALYEDKPLFWDAWDLDVFHLEKRSSLPVAALAKVMEQNALRVTVRFASIAGLTLVNTVLVAPCSMTASTGRMYTGTAWPCRCCAHPMTLIRSRTGASMSSVMRWCSKWRLILIAR